MNILLLNVTFQLILQYFAIQNQTYNYLKQKKIENLEAFIGAHLQLFKKDIFKISRVVSEAIWTT